MAAANSPASGQTIEVEAELLELAAGQVGRHAALDHVRHQRPRQRLGDPLQLLDRLGRLDEQRVGAGLLVGEAALDRGLEAERLAGVRAGDDEKVARRSRAARILAACSSVSITRLPCMWPHFFGQTWSSRNTPAAPTPSRSRIARITLSALP